MYKSFSNIHILREKTNNSSLRINTDCYFFSNLQCKTRDMMTKIIEKHNTEKQLPEKHPFEPFLPKNAKILMLCSFPPPEKRWCMDFYYPNFGNDMWRIFGIIFFHDKDHFITSNDSKRFFDKEKIIRFCKLKGIAMYDTACEVIRLKDNASDKFLEISKETDVETLLQQIPECSAIITTGQKATEVLSGHFGCDIPQMGYYVCFNIGERTLRLYRLPSSSRAYPLALDKKAEKYKSMFIDMGML